MAITQKNCCPISSDVTKNPKIGNGNEINSIRDTSEIQEIAVLKRGYGVPELTSLGKIVLCDTREKFWGLGKFRSLEDSGNWEFRGIGVVRGIGGFGEIWENRKTGRFGKV